MGVFKHVLAATDFSEASVGAVELAVTIASDSGAALTLVNVCEVPMFPESVVPVDLLTPLSEAAFKGLGDLAETIKSRCPTPRRVVKVGAAWEEILGTADEVKADLIVLGTHGRRGVVHAVMGSVAERVVRMAHVPVLTVRARRPVS
jgi:nucleotide-binding universal stress UspA family protein